MFLFRHPPTSTKYPAQSTVPSTLYYSYALYLPVHGLLELLHLAILLDKLVLLVLKLLRQSHVLALQLLGLGGWMVQPCVKIMV